MHSPEENIMERNKDGSPTGAKGTKRAGKARVARSSSNRPPKHGAATQGGLPGSDIMRELAAEALEFARGISSALERPREQLAREVADLIASGSHDQAAEQVYRLVVADYLLAFAERHRTAANTILAGEELGEVVAAGGPLDAKQVKFLRKRKEAVRSEIDALGRAFAETQNPLYVWEALETLCGPDLDGSPVDRCLPGWCLAYLSGAAEGILDLAHSGDPSEGILDKGALEHAVSAISSTLGFTRRGWNAYRAKASDDKKRRDADLLDLMKTYGIGHSRAVDISREALGIESERGVTRRVSQGRKVQAWRTDNIESERGVTRRPSRG
jgi:hypothetical protein